MEKILGRHRATLNLQGHLKFAFDQRESEVKLHKATLPSNVSPGLL